MEDNTFVILLIENSDYNSQELHKLPCAKKDRIAILSLLNNSNICTDNVHKAINQDKDKFAETWNDFAVDVQSRSSKGPVWGFVYYSGHGCIVEQDKLRATWIQHKLQTEQTPIESKVRKLGSKPNVTMFALLDCCRTYFSTKSNFESEPKKGETFIGFATQQGKAAFQQGDENSKYTKDFIDFVKKKQKLTLPRDILQWEALSYADYISGTTRNFLFDLKGQPQPPQVNQPTIPQVMEESKDQLYHSSKQIYDRDSAIELLKDENIMPQHFDRIGGSIQFFGEYAYEFFKQVTGSKHDKGGVTSQITHQFKTTTNYDEVWTPYWRILTTETEEAFHCVEPCEGQISVFVYSIDEYKWREAIEQHYLPKQAENGAIKILLHNLSQSSDGAPYEDKVWASEQGMFFMECEIDDVDAQNTKDTLKACMEYINSCEESSSNI